MYWGSVQEIATKSGRKLEGIKNVLLLKAIIEFRLKSFLELVQCAGISIIGTLPCSLIVKVENREDVFLELVQCAGISIIGTLTCSLIVKVENREDVFLELVQCTAISIIGTLLRSLVIDYKQHRNKK